MDRATEQEIAFNLSVYAVPVIPGPVGPPPATAAGPGQPGHLERLITAAPVGLWPLADRGRDVSR
jgi:hypothetical protein